MRERIGPICRSDRKHPDPAVKRAEQGFWFQTSGDAKPFEEGREPERGAVERDTGSCRQHPRQIGGKAAPRDVGKRLHGAVLQQREDGRHVNPRWPKERLSEEGLGRKRRRARKVEALAAHD